MPSKESFQSHSPSVEAFSKTAKFVRKLRSDGSLDTVQKRNWAVDLTDQVLRQEMLTKLWGIDSGPSEKLLKLLEEFPGENHLDGTVIFS